MFRDGTWRSATRLTPQAIDTADLRHSELAEADGEWASGTQRVVEHWNHDPRVSTDHCVGLTWKLVAATRRLNPFMKVVPVELVVGLSEGHQAIDEAYPLEAQFLRKQFKR